MGEFPTLTQIQVGTAMVVLAMEVATRAAAVVGMQAAVGMEAVGMEAVAKGSSPTSACPSGQGAAADARSVRLDGHRFRRNSAGSSCYHRPCHSCKSGGRSRER